MKPIPLSRAGENPCLLPQLLIEAHGRQEAPPPTDHSFRQAVSVHQRAL